MGTIPSLYKDAIMRLLGKQAKPYENSPVLRDLENPKGALRELGRETLDNFINMFRNTYESDVDALAYQLWHSIPERYKRDDIRMHTHVSGGLADFCAIFQHLATDSKGIWAGSIPPPANGDGADADIRTN